MVDKIPKNSVFCFQLVFPNFFNFSFFFNSNIFKSLESLWNNWNPNWLSFFFQTCVNISKKVEFVLFKITNILLCIRTVRDGLSFSILLRFSKNCRKFLFPQIPVSIWNRFWINVFWTCGMERIVIPQKSWFVSFSLENHFYELE